MPAHARQREPVLRSHPHAPSLLACLLACVWLYLYLILVQQHVGYPLGNGVGTSAVGADECTVRDVDLQAGVIAGWNGEQVETTRESKLQRLSAAIAAASHTTAVLCKVPFEAI